MPENLSDLEKQYNLLFETAKSSMTDQNSAIDSLNIKVSNLLIAQGFVFAAFVTAFSYKDYNFNKIEYLFLLEMLLFLCSFTGIVYASIFNQKIVSPVEFKNLLVKKRYKNFQDFQLVLTLNLIDGFVENRKTLSTKVILLNISHYFLMISLFLFIMHMIFIHFNLTDFVKICLNNKC